MTADRIICGCYDITERQVREFFSAGERSYESFVDTTGATTRCTACRLDLDLLLGSVLSGRNESPSRPDKRAVPRGAGIIEHVDSGILINRDGIRTVVRADNRPNPFDRNSGQMLTDFDWRLRVVDEEGRARTTSRGVLAVGDALVLDSAEWQDGPSDGWFWIWLSPRRAGFLGSVRPQVALVGPDWVSTVHTQPHAKACRRKQLLVGSRSGRLSALVHVINGSHRLPASCTLRLAAGGDSRERMVEVAANGSGLFNLDALFPDHFDDGLVLVTVASDVPVRKHVIQTQPGGAMSIDHFPDLK